MDSPRWYLAEIVTEVKGGDGFENVIHNNLTLIRAASPEDAYQKAMARGKEQEETYEGPDHSPITVVFRGLSDLNVIQDDLEDGAEIAYEEMVDMSESDIQELLTEKDQLGVFLPGDDDDFHDHNHNHDHDHDHDAESQSVVDEALRIINQKKEND